MNPLLKHLKKRKPIRQRSIRMNKLMRQYRKQREAYLEKHQKCCVYPWKPATQIHHTRGRTGTLLLDERFWMAVSHDGHERITNNPDWARTHGYLCAMGQWGRQEKQTT